MKHTCAALCSLFLTGILQAQTPTITSVTGLAGTSPVSPGGIAFINGTNLGGQNAQVTVGTKAAFVVNAFGGTNLQVELPVDAPLGATTIKVGASAPFNITLVQFSPGLPVNVPAPNFVFANHPSNNFAAVNTSFPAFPGEQIALSATGLGPTNPVVPTGTAPNDSNAFTTTKPTVTIGGKAATVQSAFLIPNGTPGFYFVLVTVPPDLTTGNRNLVVSIGGLNSNTGLLPVSTAPIVSSVSNAASYIDRNLPNGGIAQGSIFIVKGVNMGPGTLTIADKAFQNTSVSGTSVKVTVNGTAVDALMYYTSNGQVAALLPSNMPTGTGTIAVTYNGQTGPDSPIRVVASTLGIFTASSDGQGVGIVTYADYSLVSDYKAPNCGGVYTTCGAANPGDALIVWGTGLGAVNGSDAGGAGLGVNMPNLPLTIWLGNVQVSAVYQGRSGCCIGEDQIVFTVPANAPTGCAVPLSVQIGNAISNSVLLAIAPAGTRSCIAANPAFSDASKLYSGPGPFTFGGIDLSRQATFPGYRDRLEANFLRFTVSAAVQPFVLTYVDGIALGTCQIFNNLNGKSDPPITLVGGLDAGPQLTVQSGNNTRAVPGGDGDYRATLSANANFFAPGPITVSGPGGADVSKFNVTVTPPALPTLTSPPPDASSPTAVTRSSGLTVTWSGGNDQTYIEIQGFSTTDDTGSLGASFQCNVPSSAGSFTVPPNVLLALPAGNFGGLIFAAAMLPANFSGTGLNFTQVTLRRETFTPLSLR
ncbi:MAG TPA: hypothetical protein VKE70_12400 [Candidatus Solibacter sp.]|nr:hypothetical protein [Candidatus Solibacter sp.]